MPEGSLTKQSVLKPNLNLQQDPSEVPQQKKTRAHLQEAPKTPSGSSESSQDENQLEEDIGQQVQKKLDLDIVSESSEDENSKPVFNLVSHSNVQQREMILRAFAGDDVEARFFEEKRKIVEENLPAEQSRPTLPGWGQWSGEGIVEKPRTPNRSKAEALEKKRQEAMAKRADAKLKNVIISQKVDQKATKYQLAEAPFGTTPEAYNASLRAPLGKNWNSVLAHAELTKPRLTAKSGTTIEPIQEKIKSNQAASLSDAHKRKKRTERKTLGDKL